MQKEVEEQNGQVPMILLTHRVLEQHINDAIKALEALQGVVGPVVRIRRRTPELTDLFQGPRVIGGPCSRMF